MNYIVQHWIGFATLLAVGWLAYEVRKFRRYQERRDYEASVKAMAIAERALSVKGELD